jgi:hypothetical protein
VPSQRTNTAPSHITRRMRASIRTAPSTYRSRTRSRSGPIG